MPLSDSHLSLSPSNLSAFVACPHLTQLEQAVSRGELKRPLFHDPYAELIRRKGQDHEAAYLGRLRADGRNIVAIPRYDDENRGAEEARRLTEEAIRAGNAD